MFTLNSSVDRMYDIMRPKAPKGRSYAERKQVLSVEQLTLVEGRPLTASETLMTQKKHDAAQQKKAGGGKTRPVINVRCILFIYASVYCEV